MNKMLMCLILVCFAVTTLLKAQTPERPNAIIGKRLFIDYFTPVNGEFPQFDNYTGGFELSYIRNLGKYVNVGIPLKGGVIRIPEEKTNRKFMGIDAVAQLQLYKPESKVIPYLVSGIGMIFEDFEEVNFQIPIGIGARFRFGKFGFINWQSEYRVSFIEERDNFQHAIGIGFLIGKITDEELELPLSVKAPDQDRDGIADDEDDCPDIPGVAAFSGCPDTDLDGIEDKQDDCPDASGPRSLNGCPDKDNDGITDADDNCPDAAGTLNGCPDRDNDKVADKEDRCPEQAGPISNNGCPLEDRDKDGVPDIDDSCPDEAGKANGCPDADQDGIADKKDACPYSKGLGRFNGCPDTDGDGIDDSVDKCPNAPAPESPNGCPEVKREDRRVLEYALRAVQFEFGSAALLQESHAALDQVYNVLQKYPEQNLSIIGHTDSVGDPVQNQTLSFNRAQACFKYLTLKGISPNRIIISGAGNSRPIADNNTDKGRALNRRVEFNIVPR